MGELMIRRNRGPVAAPLVTMEKTGKTASSSASQKTAGTAAATLSETLRQRIAEGVPSESRSPESRQLLQAGAGVLAEIQEKLGRMAQLAQEAAGGNADREALQAEMDQLRGEVEQMISDAMVGGTPLFFDADLGIKDWGEALLYAVISEEAAKQETALPEWLVNGIAQNALSPAQVLAALGLDETATGPEILAALTNSSLEENSAAGYLAALYLGAVIAGSSASGGVDSSAALEGLWQLLEKIAEGLSPDQALEQLTNGAFTSLLDFQNQFMNGTAPGMEDFLTMLLLTGGEEAVLLAPDMSLMALLAGLEGTNLDLLMGLFDLGLSSEAGLAPSPESNPAANPDAAEANLEAEALPQPQAAAEQNAAEHAEGTAGVSAPDTAPHHSVLQAGTVQVMGRDLSGVSVQAGSGTLIIDGEADVTIAGTGQNAPEIRITGSGTVTLQGVKGTVLTVEAAMARIFSAGENTLGQIQLREGTSLTLGGSGLLNIGTVRADGSNTLHMTSGAVVVGKEGEELGVLTVPVILDGLVSLAAQAEQVANSEGKPLEAFDLIWKTLLPGWSGISSMELDGVQARLSLLGGDFPDPTRLWLDKGERGHPLMLVIRGRDEFGRPKTRHVHLRWEQHAGAFQEFTMYPNPFHVTGGVPNQDWTYDEESHTLYILTNQVTAVSGGFGTAANKSLFSGKLALADRIGLMKLTLNGVVCRVTAGRAFHLGQENDVTLLLERGTNNLFKSGLGCAGISLGDGTSLNIDGAAAGGSGKPAGSLTATGGAGGAGIGRDSGGGKDQTSHIRIQSGVITATGTGGGAGIGAGKRGFMGSITIFGGVITATGGKGGGSGIGAALDAPVGDISIHGGAITATAADHAAAIGAGIRGESGDILITGTARIVKAAGGNPGADIGACLFGGCGKVQVADSAEIGTAKLWTRADIPLKAGEETISLPQFCLSSRALQLDQMRVSTLEYAQAARTILDISRCPR